MSSHHRDDELDGFFEGLLWFMGLVFAGLVSQDAFFLVPLAASMALLAAARWKGEDWMLINFGWLVVILVCSLGAAAIGFVATWLNGQYT